MKNIFTLFVFALSFVGITTAQWPTNPSINLTICDTTGEQALSKIESTSDGGCYISWFDTRSENYEVYLQRLDPAGYKLWASNGLLISSHPQNTYIVDYDMMVDHNNNAIVVFSDIRNGVDLSVFAYKISSAGDFLWGNDGVSLSTTTDFQPNPKVTETNDGNFVFTWIIGSSPTKVAVQMLSSAGDKLWGTDPVLIESPTEGYNYPDVVPSDSNGVIVVHTVTTGSFPAQTVKIRATKFSSTGTISWAVMIQNLGTIAAFTVPKVYSDKNNGALVSWHDDRNNDNLQSAFVQRISSAGSIYFPENGAEASLMPMRHKFNPVAAFDSATEDTYVFWMETEPNQNQNGISGQKLSSDGTRQWTDNGKIFKDLSSPNTASISSLNAEMGSDRAYLFYLVGDAGGLNDIVEGFACDSNGDFLWTNNFVTISASTQQKLQMVSTVDPFFNCKMSWGDDRNGAAGIYAQDINPDGELGNSVVLVDGNISNPASLVLNQNYPNPFNPTTSILFTVGKREFVSLKVYDVLGNEIATLVNEEKSPGQYQINFDASEITSGVYFYRLNAGTFTQTKKMILLR
jgi:hypothetical protein